MPCLSPSHSHHPTTLVFLASASAPVRSPPLPGAISWRTPCLLRSPSVSATAGTSGPRCRRRRASRGTAAPRRPWPGRRGPPVDGPDQVGGKTRCFQDGLMTESPVLGCSSSWVGVFGVRMWQLVANLVRGSGYSFGPWDMIFHISILNAGESNGRRGMVLGCLMIPAESSNFSRPLHPSGRPVCIKVYVFGGYEAEMAHVDRYDTESLTWDTVDLPSELQGVCVATAAVS